MRFALRTDGNDVNKFLAPLCIRFDSISPHLDIRDDDDNDVVIFRFASMSPHFKPRNNDEHENDATTFFLAIIVSSIYNLILNILDIYICISKIRQRYAKDTVFVVMRREMRSHKDTESIIDELRACVSIFGLQSVRTSSASLSACLKRIEEEADDEPTMVIGSMLIQEINKEKA